MSAAAGTGITLRAGLGFLAAFGAFGYHAWSSANGGKKCRKSGKCGGGKCGAGKCGSGGCKGRRCGGAGSGAGESEADAKYDPTDPSLQTSVDVKSKAAPTREAIKKDTESALAMMHAALAPLSAEFVDYVAAKYKFEKPALERLRKLFDYNLTGGKCFRGVFVINTARYLCQSRDLNWSSRKQKAVVLAWCIEILQACFLVADDIMDGSITRRGKPCWYKLADVGLDAVNDSLILESFIYFLLERYFGGSRIELDMYKLYHEVSLQTQLGQMLDLTSNPQGAWDPKKLNEFNLDVYKRIVQFKTAYYSFYLPVASAMILCGTTGADELQVVNRICIAIGEKFQIQDDWLDCYGDPQLIGKIGTDIIDHKCSWLLVQALLRINAQQRLIIEQNYGRHDQKCQDAIKKLYSDLQLTAVYNEQEQTSYDAILAAIEQADKSEIMPRPILESLLVLIHKRQK